LVSLVNYPQATGVLVAVDVAGGVADLAGAAVVVCRGRAAGGMVASAVLGGRCG